MIRPAASIDSVDATVSLDQPTRLTSHPIWLDGAPLGTTRAQRQCVELLGIKLIGGNSETATRAVMTIVAAVAVLGIRALVLWIVRGATRGGDNDRVVFWTRQISALASLGLIFLAGISIWFDDPGRLATVTGFATAGLAIAAQRAVTSFAGYLVVMRGHTFTVGDRIKMGGVRGDVIALSVTSSPAPPSASTSSSPGSDRSPITLSATSSPCCWATPSAVWCSSRRWRMPSTAPAS